MDDLRDILQRLSAKAITEGFRDESEDFYIESNTGCEICGGRGWYTPNVPVGHPEFGQTVTCRCLEDRLTENRQARLVRYSNLGALTRFTFETLDSDGRLEGFDGQAKFRAAYSAALEFSSRPEGWMVLVGPHGTGKTHLAAAVSNRLIQNGYSVFFVHVPELLDHLRSAYSPASETTYDELFEQVKGTPILVMDELHSGNSTPWSQEKLRQLINHRSISQLPTIITTALPPEETDPYIRIRIEAEGEGRVFRLGARSHQPTSSYGNVDPRMLERMTFDSFRPGYGGLSPQSEAGLMAGYQAARNFANSPQGWLTLCGGTGSGKTHLAVAIAREQLMKGNQLMFASVPELMDRLRYAYEPDSGVSYMQLLEEIKNSPILILDDLGRERRSDWAQEMVFQILVHRDNLHLPTVITSKDDFSQDTGPISSRVKDPAIGSVVPLNAPDYRTRGGRRG